MSGRPRAAELVRLEIQSASKPTRPPPTAAEALRAIRPDMPLWASTTRSFLPAARRDRSRPRRSSGRALVRSDIA